MPALLHARKRAQSPDDARGRLRAYALAIAHAQVAAQAQPCAPTARAFKRARKHTRSRSCILVYSHPCMAAWLRAPVYHQARASPHELAKPLARQAGQAQSWAQAWRAAHKPAWVGASWTQFCVRAHTGTSARTH